MPLNTGTLINNRYRIAKLIGQGGFGAVYRAWDTNLNRPCALKENRDTSQEAQRQFEREARILAGLIHPHLPRVTDHFIVPGQGQYLVMDFVEGEDLASLLGRGERVTEEQALTWISQVAEALVYLHGQPQPVIHRDIKPANIRITPEGKAMLVDFGLVKVYDEHLKTTVGARAITPGYSPPEQYGRGNTDHRTDIYALAATLYTLLTRQEPIESVQRVVGDTLLAAHRVNPRVSQRIGLVLEQAMALNPSQRFQSTQAFLGALQGSNSSGKAKNQPIFNRLKGGVVWAAFGLAGIGVLTIIFIAVIAAANQGNAASTPTEVATEVALDQTEPAASSTVLAPPPTSLSTPVITSTALPSPPTSVPVVTASYEVTVVQAAAGSRWENGQAPFPQEVVPIIGGTSQYTSSADNLTELFLPNYTRLFLGMNTDVLFELPEDNTLVLQIGQGSLVMQSISQTIKIQNEFKAYVQIQYGLVGVTNTENPFRFAVACFIGPCVLRGDLGGELVLESGQAGFVGSNGQPAPEPNGLRVELYQFALVVPTATPTITPTFTATPTAIPTVTNTRPRPTSTYTPTPTPTITFTPQPPPPDPGGGEPDPTDTPLATEATTPPER